MNPIDLEIESTSLCIKQEIETDPEDLFSLSSNSPVYYPLEEPSHSVPSIPQTSAQTSPPRNFLKIRVKNQPHWVCVTEPSSNSVKKVDDKPDEAQFDCSSILDGTYFKVKEVGDGEYITADCQLCLPQEKTIKETKDSFSNFLKHLKKVHPHEIEDSNKYKLLKKYSKKKRHQNECHECESRKSKQAKLNEPPVLVTTKETNKPVISQSVFENRILNFVVSTMSAISLIEHQSFKDIFDGFGLEMPRTKTIMNRILTYHNENMTIIKAKINCANYLCNTADIWSNRKRSFLAVTIHWLDTNFIRKSAAIAFRRFKGVHSFKNTAEVLEDINLKFGLTENKLVGTVTGNSSNFIKTFKLFSEDDEEIDEEEDDEFQFKHLDFDEDDKEDAENSCVDIAQLKHIRCATHTLNLIVTIDYKNAVKAIPSMRTRERNVFCKCTQLWTKSNEPENNKIIIEILGHALNSPEKNRWISTYSAVSKILQAKEKLPILLQCLSLEPFKETELLYLEEYCLVMKPLALTLEFLQGEENVSFGYLLPSLVSLINKYEKLIAHKKLKYGGEHIAKMCLKSLRTRFANILNLEWEDPLTATVLLPKFKLKWYNANVLKDCKKSLDDIKKCVVNVTKRQIELEDCNKSDEGGDQNYDDFFDFGHPQEEELQGSGDNTSKQIEQNTTVNNINMTSQIQLELLRYLEDKRTNLQILNEYPTLKKVSIKYNTCLPSSAPVESLFSFATTIDTPKRKFLTDEHLEVLVLTKANSKMINRYAIYE